MIITRKVRLVPTLEQEQLLWGHAHCMRYAYNISKRISDIYYRLTGKTVSQVDLAKHFTKIKKREKFKWLKQYCADVPKQATKDFEKARNNSFNNYGNGYHVRYKSKHELEQGFYSDYVKTKVKKKSVHIPNVGLVRTSRQLPRGKKLSNPRVKFDGMYWYIAIGFEVLEKPKVSPVETFGVDVGLKELFVASNGLRKENINKTSKLKRLLRKEKQLQKDMSRRFVRSSKTQSNNYKKVKIEHLKVSRKIRNIRDNHIHQSTNLLVKAKPIKIIVEDLNIKNLMQNKKLSKAFQAQKLNFFMKCLEYKCKLNGIDFVKANRWFASSKTCSNCNYIYEHSKQKEGQWSLKIREWTCAQCNIIHDRDLNAAINLSRWVS